MHKNCAAIGDYLIKSAGTSAEAPACLPAYRRMAQGAGPLLNDELPHHSRILMLEDVAMIHIGSFGVGIIFELH